MNEKNQIKLSLIHITYTSVTRLQPFFEPVTAIFYLFPNSLGLPDRDDEVRTVGILYKKIYIYIKKAPTQS